MSRIGSASSMRPVIAPGRRTSIPSACLRLISGMGESRYRVDQFRFRLFGRGRALPMGNSPGRPSNAIGARLLGCLARRSGGELAYSPRPLPAFSH
jgi:hypothetical protein